MAFDLEAELRSLRKQVSGLKQQLNRQMMQGKVAQVKGDMVRLNIGTDKKPVLGPWTRIGGMPSGDAGGGHSQYVKPGIGEPMLLLSPGGKIGPHSRAIYYGPVDDFPSAGAAEQDGYVHKSGDARQIIKDGEVKTSVGDQSITQSRDIGIGINAAGKPVEVKGEKLTVKPPATFEQSASFGGGGSGEGELHWKGKIILEGDFEVVGGVIRGTHIGPHSGG